MLKRTIYILTLQNDSRNELIDYQIEYLELLEDCYLLSSFPVSFGGVRKVLHNYIRLVEYLPHYEDKSANNLPIQQSQ